MIGIAIEAYAACPKCGARIALNALVPTLPCIRCGAELALTDEDWFSILEDAVDEAPNMKEGEGRESSVISTACSYQITYGRQAPRYSGSKQKVDMKAASLAAEKGFLEGSERISVRTAPEKLTERFKGITLIVGEDPDLLPGPAGGTEELRFPLSESPQAFSCPQCGGSLTLDGRSRSAHCGHCGTDSFIPDPLWMKLHPSSMTRRWYLWFKEPRGASTWKGPLYDIVVNGECIYISTEPHGSEVPAIVCLGRDHIPRWKRDGLTDLKAVTTEGNMRLALAPEGRLLAWCRDRHTLHVFSRADGSDLDRLGGTKGRAPAGGRKFSMKITHTMDVDTDGTIMALQSRGKQDVDDNYYRELVRYTKDGEEIPFWPQQGKDASVLSKVKGFFSGMKAPSSFDDMGFRVMNLFDADVELSVGADGYYYMLHYERLARYDRSGEKIYGVTLPCDYTNGRPCADEKGFAFVFARDGNDKRFILRVSPNGKEVTVFADHVTRGGPISGEQRIARAPDGTLYAAGYGGRLVAIAPDGSVRHGSDESRLEREEALKEFRRKEEEEGL